MKVKKLVIDSPALMAEWNYEKNTCGNLFPNQFTVGSSKKVWWKCKKNHEWQTKIVHRSNGSGCPICSGRAALVGETDLATLYPDIAKEWDYEFNRMLTPEQVKPMSHCKVGWVCSKEGHHYVAMVQNRVRGENCPYCSNKKALSGYNDLATTNPELLDEWDYTENNFAPQTVTAGSGKKAKWICSKRHSYDATINDRVRGRGCPYCANKKVLRGFNDLGTVFPAVAKEWDYAENVGMMPEDFVYGSGKVVGWECAKKHKWKTRIVDRTLGGNGCPHCSNAKTFSFPEKALLYYVRKAFPEALGNYRGKEINGREIDIFIKEYKIGIEYDGNLWHRNVQRDNEKNEYCSKAGITLLRVREPECPKLNGESIDYLMRSHSVSEYDKGIQFVLQELSRLTGKKVNFDISIARDTIEILNFIGMDEIDRSVEKLNPNLADEWHPTKNGGILPNQISVNSNRKIWWLGKCGHEWMAAVASRNSGSGCPFCADKKVLKGFNDLSTKFPQVAVEWNYQKNNLLPEDVLPMAGKRVWWICGEGHEYQAAIVNRTRKGHGCPYCSGRRVLAGFNDFATKCPELVAEWNYERNVGLSPTEFTSGAARKVWWICGKCGHEWAAYINNRSRGSGCPRCSHAKK